MLRRFVGLGLGSLLLAAACDSPGAPYPCPTTLTISSPCGFTSVWTDCAGPAPNCATGSCTVGPVMKDCSVTAVTGDGVSHNFSILVLRDDNCGGYVITQPSAPVSFASPTCVTMDAGPNADAATDAPSDAPADAASDGSSDAAGDAATDAALD